MSPPGRFETIWRDAALLAFNTLVALVVANLLAAAVLAVRARVAPAPAPGPALPSEGLDLAYPGLSRATRDSLLAETWGRGLAPEPLPLLREKPFAGRFVNVSPFGFREHPGQGPWPPDSSRTNVFLFGGSTTFGYGVADDQALGAHLQAALAEQAPGRRVSVYNFGRGYLYSSGERLLFEKLLVEGRVPDVAVFVDGLNEFYFPPGDPAREEVFQGGPAPAAPRGSGALLAELALRTPLGRLVRGFAARRAPAAERAEEDPASDPARAVAVVRRYRANQRLIAAAAASYGVEVRFVWQPVPTYRYDLRRHAFGAEDFDRHRLSSVGYPWLDSALAAGAITMERGFVSLAGLAEGDTLPCYVDRVHYSGRMARRLAEAIAASLPPGRAE